MKQVNFRDFINEPFIPVFKSKDRELLIYGGAGAGKSYGAGQKLLLYCLTQRDKRLLVVRRTFPSLRLTSLEIIKNIWQMVGVPFHLNRSEFMMETVNNNVLIFKSLDDVEKIKSLTDIDVIWIEEPTEIMERDYEILKMRLRGRALKQGEYRQLILTFNPVDVNSWLHKRFWEGFYRDIGKFKFTYKDNKFLDPEYGKELENLKSQDEILYRVYCLGEWGVYKGQIYKNYVIENFSSEGFDDVIAGIDYGYNNPTAYLLIGVRDGEFYIFDEIYKSHLLTRDLIDLIKEKNSQWGVNPVIYAETDPARNVELIEAGLVVISAKKEVIEGINFIKMQRLHIHERCVETIKEIKGYKYKEDKNGNPLEEPVKFMDHAMDAMRYAIYTYARTNKELIYLDFKNFT